MKQPKLGYADVKLNFACMHPAGCARRVSLCAYCDLCVVHTWRGHAHCMLQKWPSTDYYIKAEHQLTKLNVTEKKNPALTLKQMNLAWDLCC